MTKSNWQLEHFSFEELACKSSHDAKFGGDFLAALDGLREVYGKPMKVNSCARSKDYNFKIKGHPNSLHVYDHPHHASGGCIAIDIDITDPADRARLISLALATDWSIGVNKTFLHLDRRVTVLNFNKTVFLY